MRALAALALATGLAVPAAANDVFHKRIGRLSIEVRARHAHPGGLFDVRLTSARRLGSIRVIFEGRAAPSYGVGGDLRALVPIPLESAPGPVTLGIELRMRRRVQRMTIDAAVGERGYPERAVEVPPALRALLDAPRAVADGRRLLLLLRSSGEDATPVAALDPPVDAPDDGSFGAHLSWNVSAPVARLTDGSWAERARGVSFEADRGSPVHAPADGTCVFAGPLTLAGRTIVIDHGRGLVSGLRHLSRFDVAEGDRVLRGQRVGLSGASGLAPRPLVHWSLVLHGIAVDPDVVRAVLAPDAAPPAGAR